MISASTPRSDGLWFASATYEADGAGVVDLTRASPHSGCYRGVTEGPVSPGAVIDFGGTAAGDEAAHVSAWPTAIRSILSN